MRKFFCICQVAALFLVEERTAQVFSSYCHNDPIAKAKPTSPGTSPATAVATVSISVAIVPVTFMESWLKTCRHTITIAASYNGYQH